MNLGFKSGDDPGATAHNRALFARAIAGVPVFLNQVHGCRVVRLGTDANSPDAPRYEADASLTTESGLACTILVADCMPVLFAAPQGRAVAAALAGWRGLSAGVLEATLEAICDAADCSSASVKVWLGPCIGPQHFEVGDDVLRAFGVEPNGETPGFEPRPKGKWLADLPLLARRRLVAAGVRNFAGGEWCTYQDSRRFFSHRRDRITGRMAAAVWIDPRACAS
jgi:YfiH family protein